MGFGFESVCDYCIVVERIRNVSSYTSYTLCACARNSVTIRNDVLSYVIFPVQQLVTKVVAWLDEAECSVGRYFVLFVCMLYGRFCTL